MTNITFRGQDSEQYDRNRDWQRRVSIARQKTGLSASRFAERIGKSPGTVLNWEKGKFSPHTVQKLALTRKIEAVVALEEVAPSEASGESTEPSVDGTEALTTDLDQHRLVLDLFKVTGRDAGQVKKLRKEVKSLSKEIRNLNKIYRRGESKLEFIHAKVNVINRKLKPGEAE